MPSERSKRLLDCGVNAMQPYNHHIVIETRCDDMWPIIELLKKFVGCFVKINSTQVTDPVQHVVIQVDPDDGNLDQVVKQVRRLGRGKKRFAVHSSWSEHR